MKLSNVFFKVFNDLPRERNGSQIKPDVLKAFCYLLDRYSKTFTIVSPRSIRNDESFDITFYDGSALNITAPLQRREIAKIKLLPSSSFNECQSDDARLKFVRWSNNYFHSMNKLKGRCHTESDELIAETYRLALAFDFKYGIAKLAGYSVDPLLGC